MKPLILILCLVCLFGCDKRKIVEDETFAPRDHTQVAMIVLDLSGSFQHLMAEEGKGYAFALNVIDSYFKAKNGSDDRLIIAQVSGNNRALLWEGKPMELRREFPSAAKFRAFLEKRGDPNASFVHEGVIHSLNYLLSEPAVASGQAKPAVFVLSDMVDSGGKPDTDQRMEAALAEFSKTSGVLGVYFCDQFLIADWRTRLQKAGIKGVVESEIVGRPTLPNFE